MRGFLVGEKRFFEFSSSVFFGVFFFARKKKTKKTHALFSVFFSQPLKKKKHPRRVDCTPPSSLGVNVNNNVGPGGWVRLVVQKTGGPGGVKSVQVKGGESGSWQPMQNKFGTAWEISSAPQLPWDFKFVSDDGQEVIATKAVDKSGRVGDLPLGVQFGPSKAASSGRKMLVDALEPAVRELLEAEAPESNAGFGAAFHVILA